MGCCRLLSRAIRSRPRTCVSFLSTTSRATTQVLPTPACPRSLRLRKTRWTPSWPRSSRACRTKSPPARIRSTRARLTQGVTDFHEDGRKKPLYIVDSWRGSLFGRRPLAGLFGDLSSKSSAMLDQWRLHGPRPVVREHLLQRGNL